MTPKSDPTSKDLVNKIYSLVTQDSGTDHTDESSTHSTTYSNTNRDLDEDTDAAAAVTNIASAITSIGYEFARMLKALEVGRFLVKKRYGFERVPERVPEIKPKKEFASVRPLHV